MGDRQPFTAMLAIGALWLVVEALAQGVPTLAPRASPDETKVPREGAAIFHLNLRDDSQGPSWDHPVVRTQNPGGVSSPSPRKLPFLRSRSLPRR
jgi:hypothetical protein